MADLDDLFVDVPAPVVPEPVVSFQDPKLNTTVLEDNISDDDSDDSPMGPSAFALFEEDSPGFVEEEKQDDDVKEVKLEKVQQIPIEQCNEVKEISVKQSQDQSQEPLTLDNVFAAGKTTGSSVDTPVLVDNSMDVDNPPSNDLNDMFDAGLNNSSDVVAKEPAIVNQTSLELPNLDDMFDTGLGHVGYDIQTKNAEVDATNPDHIFDNVDVDNGNDQGKGKHQTQTESSSDLVNQSSDHVKESSSSNEDRVNQSSENPDDFANPKETTSSKKSSNPKNESSNPKKESSHPKKESSSPKNEKSNPKKESSHPKKESSNPKKESSNPKKESSNPKKESSNPKKESGAKKTETADSESINSKKKTSSKKKESTPKDANKKGTKTSEKKTRKSSAKASAPKAASTTVVTVGTAKVSGWVDEFSSPSSSSFPGESDSSPSASSDGSTNKSKKGAGRGGRSKKNEMAGGSSSSSSVPASSSPSVSDNPPKRRGRPPKNPPASKKQKTDDSTVGLSSIVALNADAQKNADGKKKPLERKKEAVNSNVSSKNNLQIVPHDSNQHALAVMPENETKIMPWDGRFDEEDERSLQEQRIAHAKRSKKVHARSKLARTVVPAMDAFELFCRDQLKKEQQEQAEAKGRVLIINHKTDEPNSKKENTTNNRSEDSEEEEEDDLLADNPIDDNRKNKKRKVDVGDNNKADGTPDDVGWNNNTTDDLFGGNDLFDTSKIFVSNSQNNPPNMPRGALEGNPHDDHDDAFSNGKTIGKTPEKWIARNEDSSLYISLDQYISENRKRLKDAFASLPANHEYWIKEEEDQKRWQRDFALAMGADQDAIIPLIIAAGKKKPKKKIDEFDAALGNFQNLAGTAGAGRITSSGGFEDFFGGTGSFFTGEEDPNGLNGLVGDGYSLFDNYLDPSPSGSERSPNSMAKLLGTSPSHLAPQVSSSSTSSLGTGLEHVLGNLKSTTSTTAGGSLDPTTTRILSTEGNTTSNKNNMNKNNTNGNNRGNQTSNPPGTVEIDLFGSNNDSSSTFGETNFTSTGNFVIDESGDIVVTEETMMGNDDAVAGMTSTDPNSMDLKMLNGSRKQHRKTAKWTEQESEKFYESISMFGYDLVLIGSLFKDKTPIQIKTKFTTEMKKNRAKMEDLFKEGRRRNKEDRRRKKAEKEAKEQAIFLQGGGNDEVTNNNKITGGNDEVTNNKVTSVRTSLRAFWENSTGIVIDQSKHWKPSLQDWDTDPFEGDLGGGGGVSSLSSLDTAMSGMISAWDGRQHPGGQHPQALMDLNAGQGRVVRQSTNSLNSIAEITLQAEGENDFMNGVSDIFGITNTNDMLGNSDFLDPSASSSRGPQSSSSSQPMSQPMQSSVAADDDPFASMFV